MQPRSKSGGLRNRAQNGDSFLAPHPAALFCWTRDVLKERIIGMPTTNITGPDRAGRFPHVGRQCKGGRSLLSRIPRWIGGMLLAIGIYFCSNPALDAQTSNSQAG